MGQSNYVHLDDCQVVKETNAAFLVRYDGREIWLPKSQMSDPEDYEVGDGPVTITITEWIAKQKGIE